MEFLLMTLLSGYLLGLIQNSFRNVSRVGQKSISGVFSGVIAIDGQTHRGAKKNGETKSAVHMVSAWAAGLRMVIAQTKVGEKTNEITAIPEVLRLLDLKGCIVTIDAMGCQQAIARQIIDQGGDYILGLKGNQGLTLEAVEEHFSTTSESVFEIHSEADKGHGRIEDRKYYASEAKSVCDMKATVPANVPDLI